VSTPSEKNSAVDATAEARLGHGALVAFNRALTRYSTRGALEERDGVVLCAGGSWIPVVANVAFRTSDDVSAAEVVARAEAFYGQLGRGFTVMVRDDGSDEDLRTAALGAGLEPFGEGAPQMLARGPLDGPAAVDGVELRAVENTNDVRAFTEVNSAAYATYGMPEGVLERLFDRETAVLDDTCVHPVVAWRGSQPVAAALVYESDGVATVQWVGTVPHERGTGLGALVTAWTTNLAFDRGASSCTLQASSMGEPIYRRLGYEAIYRYNDYVRWQPRPAE
jgi:GNAT superfamily N-acetyltransferase